MSICVQKFCFVGLAVLDQTVIQILGRRKGRLSTRYLVLVFTIHLILFSIFLQKFRFVCLITDEKNATRF